MVLEEVMTWDVGSALALFDGDSRKAIEIVISKKILGLQEMAKIS